MPKRGRRGNKREGGNNLGDGDRSIDRNQNVCTVSKAMWTRMRCQRKLTAPVHAWLRKTDEFQSAQLGLRRLLLLPFFIFIPRSHLQLLLSAL